MTMSQNAAVQQTAKASATFLLSYRRALNTLLMREEPVMPLSYVLIADITHKSSIFKVLKDIFKQETLSEIRPVIA